MAMKFDRPLYSLSSKEENDQAKALWEAESLGGMTEDNNRTPVPVVFLVILTVITAFLMTFPLWGQRPTAAIYADYVKSMNTPEIMAMTDDTAAMAKIVQLSLGKQQPSKWNYDALRERHPVTMDDMRMIKPQIEALMAKGVDLEDYTVVGNKVVFANFEGNFRADGTRERKQPWWDQGYTIDIFYLIAFFLGVTIVVKCLPSYKWQPKHDHDHSYEADHRL
jgi:hypothetical protein